MKSTPLKTFLHAYLLPLALILAIIGAGLYGYFDRKRTDEHLKKIEDELVRTQAELTIRSDEFTALIDDLKKENITLSSTLKTEQEKTGSVASQVGQITSSVTHLEKLTATDPELLKKYSKVYFLNEHYVPLSLAPIDKKYSSNGNLQIEASVAPYLQKLLDAAASTGLGLEIDSAYRSFGTQAQLKASYRFTYGAGTANQFSAEQGYSEHQLGTTIDFTTKSINGALAGFDTTAEYAWLGNNAYKYGFILSYPKDNTYYEYEPWHWRFVGVALATRLHNENKYFYDTDQRVIDTYLANIFD